MGRCALGISGDEPAAQRDGTRLAAGGHWFLRAASKPLRSTRSGACGRDNTLAQRFLLTSRWGKWTSRSSSRAGEGDRQQIRSLPSQGRRLGHRRPPRPMAASPSPPWRWRRGRSPLHTWTHQLLCFPKHLAPEPGDARGRKGGETGWRTTGNPPGSAHPVRAEAPKAQHPTPMGPTARRPPGRGGARPRTPARPLGGRRWMGGRARGSRDPAPLLRASHPSRALASLDQGPHCPPGTLS